MQGNLVAGKAEGPRFLSSQFCVTLARAICPEELFMLNADGVQSAAQTHTLATSH